MAKRPFKKKLVVSSVSSEEPNEDSLTDADSSIKSLGSFKLRFKTGETVRKPSLQDPVEDPFSSKPEPLEPLSASLNLPLVPPEVETVPPTPKEDSPEPEVRIVDIPRARRLQLDSTSKEPLPTNTVPNTESPEVRIVEIPRARRSQLIEEHEETVDLGDKPTADANAQQDLPPETTELPSEEEHSNTVEELPMVKDTEQSVEASEQLAEEDTHFEATDNNELPVPSHDKQTEATNETVEAFMKPMESQNAQDESHNTDNPIESPLGESKEKEPHEPEKSHEEQTESHNELYKGLAELAVESHNQSPSPFEVKSIEQGIKPLQDPEPRTNSPTHEEFVVDTEMRSLAGDIIQEKPQLTDATEDINGTSNGVSGGDHPIISENSDDKTETSEESFYFLPPEEEPVLSPDFEERAIRSVSAVVIKDPTPVRLPSYQTVKCKANCENCCTFDLCTSKNSRTPNLSPEAHQASKQGLTMMKKLIYPGMPKIVQDLWVLTELTITITQFILAVTTLSFDPSQLFNILFLTISSLGVLLALFDAFLHFIQLGSLAVTIRYFRKLKKKRRESLAMESLVQENDENGRYCLRLSKKRKEQVGEVLDFIRNWVTDVVLYPLVVLDLYDLIRSQAYQAQTASDRVDLSLFVINAIFLILGVYVARLVLILTAAFNIRKVPTEKKESHKKVVEMALRFLLHVFVQVLVHASIFITLGTNVYLENTEFVPVTNTTELLDFITVPLSSVNSSFFLIFSAIAGLFVTQLGILSFFIVNYYQIRELSIGFWVNMIALLQSESFTGLVFDGGLKSAKKQTKKIVQNVRFKKVKSDLQKIESVTLFTKLFYPFRVPVFVLLGIVYGLLLVAFLAFFSIVCRPISGAQGALQCQSFFVDPTLFSIPYFFTFALVILANIHVIIMVLCWAAFLLLIVMVIIFAPIILLLYVLSYVPFGAIALCCMMWSDLAKEMDITTKPGAKVEYLRRQDYRRNVRKTLFGQN